MNRHIIQTDDSVDDAAVLAALEAAGIDARVKPLHQQRLAKVAADLLAEYPVEQWEKARDKLVALIDEALDDADEARAKRIDDSIDRLERDHGELTTWRCAGVNIALGVPSALITSIARADGARRDVELRMLTGLMLPQLERISSLQMQRALGSEYTGKRSDYQRLMELACRELSV
ncbi:hypothetical protein [Vreelandella salicampi]|uniref:Uncharacterized protein n=1 Tax=Vreelandella salicampi TaxID=1449798 RepID=A0A7Z0RWB9_9GAMM|nr:hypothetical protein [Halomonas salicampi]NYS62601.1 hypothetical protein [Halomonas salicampi]